MSTLPFRFLALPDDLSNYADSRFAILPIPYDATVSYQVGTRNGPRAILEASQQLEDFDEELGADYSEVGMATLDALEAHCAGPEAMHERILETARRIMQDGKFLIGLGGEHGVTPGLVRAVAETFDDLSVLQIDAHLDLRDTYQGTKYSHASAMRRVMEYGANIVPVGVRNVGQEEHEFLKTVDISPITARECRFSDDWLSRALAGLRKHVYITIDIDGFDPACAPGTGTPEPGGLDWYQVTGLLRAVAEKQTIVGADVVEVLPIPGQAVTEFLAARLVYKLIAYCCFYGQS